MYGSPRSLPAVVVPVFVLVAIVGYVAGHHGAPAVPKEKTRIASGAGIQLEYPLSWQPATTAPTVPGLSTVHSLLLAPGGNSAHAGLLTGQLPSGEPSPLPGRFLAVVPGIPHTEIVDLVDVQAYRYAGLHLPGFEPTLDLYVAPNPGHAPTALVCYASKELSSELRRCEQIVETLTLVGISRSYDLNPDAGYARRLGTLIGTLDSERVTLRRQMQAGSTPAAVGGFATTLADRLGAAAASLAVLETPLTAGPAQAALSGSILRARDTYRELAAAAAAGNLTGYNAARSQVDEAETGVDKALENFALLGYGHT